MFGETIERSPSHRSPIPHILSVFMLPAALCASVWLYTLIIQLPLWIEYRFWVPVLLVSAALGAMTVSNRFRVGDQEEDATVAATGSGAKSIRILRVIARLNVGGPARHVVWLTEGLKPEGYETLLVAGVVPANEDDMSYVAQASGVRPLILPQMSREISVKDLLTIWKLFRLMRRERPQIVHTHTAKAGTVGRLAGLMYRWSSVIEASRSCSFVHTYHGHVFHSYYGKFKTGLFLNIERFLARFATDRIVVISDQQRHEINEVFRVGRSEQFAVIPLGIDLSVYSSWPERRARMRAEMQFREDEMLIGIIGRVTGVKNHRLMLEAAALLRKDSGLKFRVVVIGDGDLRHGLQEYAKSLGLEDVAVFVGTRNDPENFYPALDIVALTSLNEGTPLTLIEAMANARPVIATSVGGVVDLLGAPIMPGDEGADYQICQRGVSVASGDARGLARGLRRLIEDPELRDNLGQKGLEFVVRNYAKERLFKDMAELYRDLKPTA
jgi:glycosyltransferase involved in cell wall biosynthesis